MKFPRLRTLVGASAALAASAMALGAAGAPGKVAPAAKKTIKFTCTVTKDAPASQPTNVHGKLSCTKPLGKGVQTGKLVVPKSIAVWHFKGGTVHVTASGKANGAIAKGTFKVTGGTGKYRGAKGKGTFVANLGTGVTKNKGSFRY
jgi:hypothetical protein